MESTIISAIAALAGVLLGQVLARSGEYKKWLRIERHRVAAELLAAGEAIRVHSTAEIVSAFKGASPEPGEPSFGEVYLVDLQRLELAVEAVCTVFPARVAAVARRFDGAARGVARIRQGESPSTPTAGDVYKACRSELTDEVRRLVAPSFGDRFRSRRAVSSRRNAAPARLHQPDGSDPGFFGQV